MVSLVETVRMMQQEAISAAQKKKIAAIEKDKKLSDKDRFKAIDAVMNEAEGKMCEKCNKVHEGSCMGEDNTNDKSDDGEGMDKVQPKALKKKFDDRKDKDIDNDGDEDDSDEYLHNRRKTVSKAVAKEEAELEEAPRRKGAPKMTGDSVAIQRAKDAAHNKAMGRTRTGRKSPERNTSTKNSLASLRREEVELDENMSRIGKELEAYARKEGGVDKNDFMKAAMMMKKGQKRELMKFVDDLDTDPRDKILQLLGKDADRRKEYKAYQKSKRNEEVEIEEGAKEKALKALMTKALNGKKAKAGTTSAVAQNGDFVVKDGGGRVIGRLKAGTFTDPLNEATAKQRALANIKAQPKDKVSLKKAPWDKKDKKEEVEDDIPAADAKPKKNKKQDPKQGKGEPIDVDPSLDEQMNKLMKRKSFFESRYGARAESVMLATAKKLANKDS